jgi:hypothetical protein
MVCHFSGKADTKSGTMIISNVANIVDPLPDNVAKLLKTIKISVE